MKKSPKLPDPPETLAPDAQERWRAVVPELARTGEVDQDLLAVYCQVWARWRKAESTIATTGMLVKKGGHAAPSPLLAIARQASAEARALEQRLGIGAAAEEPDEPETTRTSTLLTRREIAEAFGVHMMSITKWERDGLPIAERGRKGKPSRYRLPECVQWFIRRELAAKGVAGGDSTPQQERALLDRQRREEIELRLKMRRGDLVPREETARDFNDCANNTKARMRRIPSAIADQVLVASVDGPAAIQAVILRAIDEALLELSERANMLPQEGAA